MKNYILMKPTHMALKTKSTGESRNGKVTPIVCSGGVCAPKNGGVCRPRKSPRSNEQGGMQHMPVAAKEGIGARVFHLGIDVHLCASTW